MRVLEKTTVVFTAEDETKLSVSYTNRGEPFRKGVELSLEFPEDRYGGHLFLEDREARELRDLLNNLYPRNCGTLSD